MKDFKSYYDDGAEAGGQKTGGDSGKKTGGDRPTEGAGLNNTLEMAKIIAAAMNGKSTAQIMQTIISEAERGKREGRLTNADLDNFYQAVYPVLDGAKRRKLKEVIARLKQI